MSRQVGIFRVALKAFPEEFREEFADEMTSVFHERCSERGAATQTLFAAGESIDAVFCGFRMRLAGHARQPVLAASIVVAMLATTLALQGPNVKQESRIDFRGHDPLGAFTITVVNGKAVGATVDSVAVPTARIVQKKDSIVVLGSDGNVELAVRFDPGTDSIFWNSRQ